jgi:hypothetical protein
VVVTRTIRTPANRLQRVCLAALLSLLSVLAAAAEPEVRTLFWEDLMPPGWEPAPLDYSQFFLALENLDDETLDDDYEDPEVPQERDAPVVAELNGVRARIPGYLVPVSMHATRASDALLVPYFGACIHTPPPPSNQVVLVQLPKPMSLDELWDIGAVWITGELKVGNQTTETAQAGYAMRGERIEIYRFEPD